MSSEEGTSSTVVTSSSLTPTQFVSTSHPCTLSDDQSLKQFFEQSSLFIREKIHHLETLDQKRDVLIKVKQETIDTINQILKLYGYVDLVSESGEEFWFFENFKDDQNVHDGKKISIRIMILVVFYCGLYTKMVEELDTVPVLQFFSYVEQCVVPKIVNCAKEIASRALQKQTVQSFEMNTDDMENWQQAIVHLYVVLQVEFITWGKQSIYEFGAKGCSTLSCFTMLALLKYYSEKRNKFFKENTSGQLCKLREQDSALLRQILTFWSVFQEFMDRQTAEDDEDSSDSEDEEDQDEETKIPKRKMPHGLDSNTITNLKIFYSSIFIFYIPIMVESIYDFSELPNTESLKEFGNQRVKDECIDIANSVLVYVSGAKPVSAQFLKSLIDMDYNEVKDLSNSSIITDPSSRNCGKYVWIVKQKILNTICLNLEELCTPESDTEVGTSLAKLTFALEFVFPFGDFLIKTLTDTDDHPSSANLKRIATLASLSLSRTFLSGNELKLQQLFIRNNYSGKFDRHPHYLSKFNLDILEIWKKNLFSTDDILRENTCFSLSVYFTEVQESRITDDLIESVIKSFEANISNMSQYSILLSALIDKIEYSSSSFVNDFRRLLTRLFEIICKANGVEYLANIAEDKKAEVHKKNIIFYFETLHDSYYYIKNGFEFNLILLHIKEKTEEMWRDGTFKQNIEIVLSYIVAVKELSRATNFEAILKFYQENNFFTFLTKLIRSSIENTEISQTVSRGPIYQLIGILSNIGLLDLCPFDDDSTNGAPSTDSDLPKHFTYDFILPTVIDEALPPKNFFTDQIIIDSSNLPKRIDTLTQSSWALGRLLFNDLKKNDTSRSQAVFVQNIDRFLLAVKYLTGYDFYTTEEIRNLLLAYQDKLLLSGLLITQSKAVELIGVQFGKIFTNLCEIIAEELMSGEKSDGIYLAFVLLLLIDYLIDCHPDAIALDEVAIFFAPVLPAMLNECNTYQSAVVKRIFNKIILIE